MALRLAQRSAGIGLSFLAWRRTREPRSNLCGVGPRLFVGSGPAPTPQRVVGFAFDCGSGQGARVATPRRSPPPTQVAPTGLGERHLERPPFYAWLACALCALALVVWGRGSFARLLGGRPSPTGPQSLASGLPAPPSTKDVCRQERGRLHHSSELRLRDLRVGEGISWSAIVGPISVRHADGTPFRPKTCPKTATACVHLERPISGNIPTRPAFLHLGL